MVELVCSLRFDKTLQETVGFATCSTRTEGVDDLPP